MYKSLINHLRSVCLVHVVAAPAMRRAGDVRVEYVYVWAGWDLLWRAAVAIGANNHQNAMPRIFWTRASCGLCIGGDLKGEHEQWFKHRLSGKEGVAVHR